MMSDVTDHRYGTPWPEHEAAYADAMIAEQQASEAEIATWPSLTPLIAQAQNAVLAIVKDGRQHDAINSVFGTLYQQIAKAQQKRLL